MKSRQNCTTPARQQRQTEVQQNTVTYIIHPCTTICVNQHCLDVEERKLTAAEVLHCTLQLFEGNLELTSSNRYRAGEVHQVLGTWWTGHPRKEQHGQVLVVQGVLHAHYLSISGLHQPHQKCVHLLGGAASCVKGLIMWHGIAIRTMQADILNNRQPVRDVNLRSRSMPRRAPALVGPTVR